MCEKNLMYLYTYVSVHSCIQCAPCNIGNMGRDGPRDTYKHTTNRDLCTNTNARECRQCEAVADDHDRLSDRQVCMHGCPCVCFIRLSEREICTHGCGSRHRVCISCVAKASYTLAILLYKHGMHTGSFWETAWADLQISHGSPPFVQHPCAYERQHCTTQTIHVEGAVGILVVLAYGARTQSNALSIVVIRAVGHAWRQGGRAQSARAVECIYQHARGVGVYRTCLGLRAGLLAHEEAPEASRLP